MKRTKKISWLDTAITWRQSLKLSVIGMIVGLLWCLVLWLWYKWDDFVTTFRSMKNKLMELELWRSKKDREGA